MEDIYESAENFLLKFSVWHLKSHKDKSALQIIFLLKLPALQLESTSTDTSKGYFENL